MKPRKWAKEIKQWANGAILQWRVEGDEEWSDNQNVLPTAMTADGFEIRVKPEEPERMPNKGDLMLGWDSDSDSSTPRLDVFNRYEEKYRAYPWVMKYSRWAFAKPHPLQQKLDKYREALDRIQKMKSYASNVEKAAEIAKEALK